MKGFYLILLAVLAGGVSCSDRDSDVVLTAWDHNFHGAGQPQRTLVETDGRSRNLPDRWRDGFLQADPQECQKCFT